MKYNNILFTLLLLIIVLFISYKLCDINPGKYSKRKFFCKYPIYSSLFFIFITLIFIFFIFKK